MDSESSRQYRIFLIDAQPIVRLGFRKLISQESDLIVCGEAGDAPAAFPMIAETRPHLVIADLSLKDSQGTDLIEELARRFERLPILVVSSLEECLFAERVLRAGALGYVNKEEANNALLHAIRRVLDGDTYLSPAMAERLLKTMVGGEPLDRDPLEQLSNRELQVFQMIGRGLGTKEIAQQLHLSPKTIETHREKLKAKLNAADGVELFRRAVQWVLENG